MPVARPANVSGNLSGPLQTRSPPNNLGYSGASDEVPIVLAHKKSRVLATEDDLPFRKQPPAGKQWPVAPSFSQRRSVTRPPDLPTDDPASPLILEADNISINRLLMFGNFCSPEKKDRIGTWINRLACQEEMQDVVAAMPATADLYKDWLHWCKHAALTWLGRLDKLERRFPIASFHYHSTPYALRHSNTLLHGSKIDQAVLNRMSDILETDRLRTQQTFFVPWYEIRDVAVDILKDLNNYEPITDDPDFLRIVHCKFELSLLKAPKALRTLVEGLEWIEGIVAEVADRFELDGSEALASKFSREGSLFRRWMLTLPEFHDDFVESKSKYIEWYVERLFEVGVEQDKYWSSLVEEAPSNDGSKDDSLAA